MREAISYMTCGNTKLQTCMSLAPSRLHHVNQYTKNIRVAGKAGDLYKILSNGIKKRISNTP